MADQMPPNDPLDNRLRATFNAERDDIERRHLAGGATPARSRSLKWIPFAIAAAVIAIVGFAFIGNRSNDQAVELDVAAQTPDNQTPADEPAPTDVPVPVDASGQPVPVDENGQPLPTPVGEPDADGMPVPHLTGENMCGASFELGTRVVFLPDRGSAPALAAPQVSGEIGVTRMLQDGTVVQLVGGCARAQADGGLIAWYEIVGEVRDTTEWVQSEYLATVKVEVPPSPTQAANECAVYVLRVPHFVWNVLVTDPDGGLIAHTGAGVNEPVTRIIGFDQIVTPTGGCMVAENGALWYELNGPELTTDWVNNQFLKAAVPACLQREQFGTRARNGQRIHVVAPGDRLDAIAEEYSIDIAELVIANPQLDPNLIISGEPIWIPGLPAKPEPISGPLAGWAATDGDLVAFGFDGTNYRWYPAEGISVGAQCFPLLAGDDSLSALRCLRVAAPVTDSGGDPLEYTRWPAGAASSTADHVHDIRTEANDTCTRIVVTFGDHANEDGLDAASTTLPPIVVNQGLDFVRISPNGWAMESAFMDADRVDYPGGVGLLTLSPGFEFAVELLHTEMKPNVRFFDNPARVVIDLFPIEDPDPAVAGPFGERFVLRQPIQIDLTGPGIPVDNDIVVEGFGRPFEAAGLYRIWAVPDDVDPDVFLANPPEPMVEEFFPTGGWAEGWGTFSIDLPDLEPGSYIAVFGELPPTDEIGFYGTGQLFRVADAPTEEPGTWPPAVLLPNVQLPPE